MNEIARTNDPVLLSFIDVLLRDAGISAIIADVHMSVLEGSLGVLPRRVLVACDDESTARKILEDAGLGAQLRPEQQR